MVSTTKRVDARERARQARLRIDAEREQRDREIEEAATEYFRADDERTKIADQLNAAQTKVDIAIRGLLDLGESPRRVADLLELDAAAVRRARATGTPEEVETAAPDGADSTSEHEQS